MKMQYVIYLLMIALFVSCDSETLDGGDAPPSQSVINLAVSVTLPQPEEVDALTRASYTDTNILNLDLLVFDANAKFMERIKVESSQLEVTPAGIDFTVRVNAAPHDRIIHIVVNGRSADGLTDRLNLDDITEGMDERLPSPL